ncbi:MAG: phosphoribosylformylglycinamidine synthase I [Candidatus Methanomethylicia archaeon]
MKPRVLIIRVAGTNCDVETARAVEEAGMSVLIIHTNKLINRSIDLFDFHALIIPGGFSYGDYVRAGAIWAAKISSKLNDDIISFSNSGKPILGICNGFQILVELGLIPGWDYASHPQIALAPNISGKFECRWVFLKPNGINNVFMKYYDENSIVSMPVAHSEGRFIASKDVLDKLFERGQVTFQYSRDDGGLACGNYPYNPNGSYMDIAGVCNSSGNVMGLMPHPERATYYWQYPHFRSIPLKKDYYGDGYWIFKSMHDYIMDKII